jgi:hypothetical protein
MDLAKVFFFQLSASASVTRFTLADMILFLDLDTKLEPLWKKELYLQLFFQSRFFMHFHFL